MPGQCCCTSSDAPVGCPYSIEESPSCLQFSITDYFLDTSFPSDSAVYTYGLNRVKYLKRSLVSGCYWSERQRYEHVGTPDNQQTYVYGPYMLEPVVYARIDKGVPSFITDIFGTGYESGLDGTHYYLRVLLRDNINVYIYWRLDLTDTPPADLSAYFSSLALGTPIYIMNEDFFYVTDATLDAVESCAVENPVICDYYMSRGSAYPYAGVDWFSSISAYMAALFSTDWRKDGMENMCCINANLYWINEDTSVVIYSCNTTLKNTTALGGRYFGGCSIPYSVYEDYTALSPYKPYGEDEYAHIVSGGLSCQLLFYRDGLNNKIEIRGTHHIDWYACSPTACFVSFGASPFPIILSKSDIKDIGSGYLAVLPFTITQEFLWTNEELKTMVEERLWGAWIDRHFPSGIRIKIELISVDGDCTIEPIDYTTCGESDIRVPYCFLLTLESYDPSDLVSPFNSGVPIPREIKIHIYGEDCDYAGNISSECQDDTIEFEASIDGDSIMTIESNIFSGTMVTDPISDYVNFDTTVSLNSITIRIQSISSTECSYQKVVDCPVFDNTPEYLLLTFTSLTSGTKCLGMSGNEIQLIRQSCCTWTSYAVFFCHDDDGTESLTVTLEITKASSGWSMTITAEALIDEGASYVVYTASLPEESYESFPTEISALYQSRSGPNLTCLGNISAATVRVGTINDDICNPGSIYVYFESGIGGYGFVLDQDVDQPRHYYYENDFYGTDPWPYGLEYAHVYIHECLDCCKIYIAVFTYDGDVGSPISFVYLYETVDCSDCEGQYYDLGNVGGMNNVRLGFFA